MLLNTSSTTADIHEMRTVCLVTRERDRRKQYLESRLPAIYDPKSTRRKKGARMGETAPASPKREKAAASAELGNTTPSSWAPELPVDSLAAFSSSTWKTDFSSARSRAGYTQRLKDIREAYGVISNASKSDEAKLDHRVSQLLDMCVDIVEKQKKRWDQVRGALTQMARRTDSLETVRIVENLALDLGDTMKVESRIVELSKKVHASSVNHRAAENKCETLRKQAKKLESELTVTKIELANRTKECGALQRRVNASARRYEQLSKNVDTLQRELAIATAELEARENGAQPNRNSLATSRGSRDSDERGAHAKRARYLANQLALAMQQLAALERQKKWWMAKSAVLEAEASSLIAYNENVTAASADEDMRSRLTHLVWKIMNESPLEDGYGFVNTVAQLKGILSEGVGKKVNKLPEITPYHQRGTTMITPFKANGIPIPKGYMVLSPQQIDFLTMVTSTRGRCALPYLCDADSVATERGRQDCINALGTEFWAQQRYANAVSKAFGRLKDLFEVHAIDHLINTLISITCEALDCDRGSLWVVDSTQGIMWTYVQNAGETEFRRLEMELPKRGTDPYSENIGLVASAYLLKEAISIYNAYEDKRFNRSFDRITNYRTRSVLCLPVVNEGRVTCIVQAVNKRRDPVFDKDDETILRNIAVLGLEMVMVFEKTAVSGWSMKRQTYLLQFATEMMQYCTKPSTLVNLLTLYLNELFQAKEVALHLVVGGVTAQIIAGGSQRSHATPTEAQKQLDKNLRPCLAGMTGIVGLTANSRCPQTFSFPSPGSSRSSRRIHDKLSGVYDALVDLSPPELVDSNLRRNSRKERYVLQSYPLFDKRTTTAVLQFVCADGKRTTFGNDEVFDPFNVGHTKVLKQICNYVVVLLREWYPVADRRALHDIWAKAAKNVNPADTVVSAAPTEDNKDAVHSEGSESEYSADHEDSEEEGEEDDDAVEVTVSGGGQLWGLTEEERQIDWRTAEPGWDVRSLATIYQSSFEAGLMAAQDVVNNLMNAS